MGAAVLMSHGLGHIPSLDDASHFIQADGSYTPNPEAVKVYDKIYPVFKRLYGKNRKNFRMLNQGGKKNKREEAYLRLQKYTGSIHGEIDYKKELAEARDGKYGSPS
jgi:hypothetical protein